MKIVFLGSGAFGLPSLERLLQAGHEISLVVSQPDRPAGRGGHLTPTPIAEFAARSGLATLKPADVNAAESIAAIAAQRPDLLVVIAFGQKLSDALLATARQGGINLHASLLPAFRGAAPINWAIIQGCKQTGVSVICVNAVMDGGGLLASATTPIGEDENAGELHDRLAQLGSPVLAEVVQTLASGGEIHGETDGGLDGKPRGAAQNTALATRAPKLSRTMAWVDFTADAEAVSCRMRGLAPWPGCGLMLYDEAGKPRVKAHIHKCRACAAEELAPRLPGLVLGDLSVACGRGRLELLELQPEGRKKMRLAEFSNGYGYQAGCRWESVMPVPAGVKC